ncbi:hypothetical protein Unana1_03410 [Umbelopsis nana]
MRFATLSFLAAFAVAAIEAAPNNLAVTVSCQKQYIVQANDKCYKIASAYKIKASQLLKWNPQVNPSCTNLYIGETLCLSAPTSASSVVAAAKTTTTKKTTNTSAKTTTTTKSATKTITKTSTVPSTTVIVPTAAQCASDDDCPGITCCNLFTKQCVLDPNNNICDIQPTTKVSTTISGKPTVTKVTTTLSSTKATPTPTYVSGVTVSLDSADSFCLLLPPSAGNKANNGGKQDVNAISDSEDYAVSFCTMPNINAPGARSMPAGFITSANYQTNSTAGFIQVTGKINPSAYGLSSNDQGGQYDNHGQGKPNFSACKGFPYYVQLVEPNLDGFCIRCCMSYQDCNASRSEYGCKRVVPVLSHSV